MFWLLLRNEFTKLKSTLALWMMLLMPLSIVLLTLLMTIADNSSRLTVASQYASQTLAFWMLLIQPMYLAISAVLLLSLEHRHQGWQRLYVLPIRRGALYLAKMTVLIVLQVGAALTLLLLTWLSIAILQLTGELTLDPFSLGSYGLAMVKGLSGGLVVLTIQHYLSTRWSSFVIPLVVAVAGSLTIPSVAQSERFWKFDPWSYSLIASSANNTSAQQWAVVLSLGLATVVVLFALWDIHRRELR